MDRPVRLLGPEKEDVLEKLSGTHHVFVDTGVGDSARLSVTIPFGFLTCCAAVEGHLTAAILVECPIAASCAETSGVFVHRGRANVGLSDRRIWICEGRLELGNRG
jgi:hypothetical protein